MQSNANLYPTLLWLSFPFSISLALFSLILQEHSSFLIHLRSLEPMYTSISQMSSKAKATSSLNASLSLSSEQSEARKRLNLVCQNFVEIVPLLSLSPSLCCCCSKIPTWRTCYIEKDSLLNSKLTSCLPHLHIYTSFKLVFHSTQLFILCLLYYVHVCLEQLGFLGLGW